MVEAAALAASAFRPRGRGDAALPFLEAFVAEATGGGLVADLIREHGVEGKVVVAS